MTLRVNDPTDTSLNWYVPLTKNPKYHILWGVHDDGNVYDIDNLKSVATYILHQNKRLGLVISDGGLGIHTDKGQKVESLKEFYTARIILSELLLCLMTLRFGGHFVCKLVGALSHFTNSIIWLCCQLWQTVYIVKPSHSRVINSESYLVCKWLQPQNVKVAISLLTTLHGKFENGYSPISVVPIDWICADNDFMRTSGHANTIMTKMQTDALRAVCDQVAKLNNVEL